MPKPLTDKKVLGGFMSVLSGISTTYITPKYGRAVAKKSIVNSPVHARVEMNGWSFEDGIENEGELCSD